MQRYNYAPAHSRRARRLETGRRPECVNRGRRSAVAAELDIVEMRLLADAEDADELVLVACRAPAMSALLWEFGNQFEKFGLRPSPDGSGAHVSQRADREREFSNVVPIWGIDNEKEVVVAGS
jgi:hypothetical protein